MIAVISSAERCGRVCRPAAVPPETESRSIQTRQSRLRGDSPLTPPPVLLQIKLVNIRPEDIVDGNPKLTLGLIWTIILHFQVSPRRQSGQASLSVTASVTLSASADMFASQQQQQQQQFAFIGISRARYSEPPLPPGTSVPGGPSKYSALSLKGSGVLVISGPCLRFSPGFHSSITAARTSTNPMVEELAVTGVMEFYLPCCMCRLDRVRWPDWRTSVQSYQERSSALTQRFLFSC